MSIFHRLLLIMFCPSCRAVSVVPLLPSFPKLLSSIRKAFRIFQPSMAAVPMNTQHIKITTLIIFNVLPKVWSQTPLYWTGNAPNPAVAVSGTWATAQFTAALWSTTSTSPPTVSWTDGDVAHFVGSAAVTATLGSNISAAGINFDPGANSVTIDTKGNQLNGKTLTINGPGIVNNSGMTQTITNNGSEEQLPVSGAGQILAPGSTSFINASTAGDTAITNNGGTVSGGGGGSTEFFNGS